MQSAQTLIRLHIQVIKSYCLLYRFPKDTVYPRQLSKAGLLSAAPIFPMIPSVHMLLQGLADFFEQADFFDDLSRGISISYKLDSLYKRVSRMLLQAKH